MDFRTELQRLINMHSRENGSNTPDFILAKFLEDCLTAFDVATNTRTLRLQFGEAVDRVIVGPQQHQAAYFAFNLNEDVRDVVQDGKLFVSAQTFSLYSYVPRLGDLIRADQRAWRVTDFNPTTDIWCCLPVE